VEGESSGEEGGERAASEAGVRGGLLSRDVGRERLLLERPGRKELPSTVLDFLSALSARKTPLPFSRGGEVEGAGESTTSDEELDH